MIYTILVMIALLGFTSVAIDFGRYQTCKTELRRTAIAAARAGVSCLTSNPPTNTQITSAQTAATTIADANTCDGSLVTSSMVTIDFIKWTSSSNYTVLSSSNYTQAIAVRVTVTKTVPLIFAQVVGMSGKAAVESSTAMIATYVVKPFIATTSNPWLAGQTTTGTTASEPDGQWAGQKVNSDHPWQYDLAGPEGGKNSAGEPYASPIQIDIPVTPGATITISNASGSGGNDTGQGSVSQANGYQNGWYDTTYDTNSDDEAAWTNGEEHGIADATGIPLDSVVGVFLNNNLPDTDSGTIPAVKDWSSQSTRDYTSYSPQLKQPFYAGSGQTSTNQQQEIVVPTGATRFYLGTMDGHEWSNNVGGYNVTVTETIITLVQ